MLSKLFTSHEAFFFLALTFPLAGMGLLYSEAIAFKKSKVKFVHKSKICKELEKIGKFEAGFLAKAGLMAGLWIGTALLLLGLVAMLPIWREPVKLERPDTKEVTEKTIRLKKEKVKSMKEVIEDDDGNSFIVEK